MDAKHSEQLSVDQILAHILTESDMLEDLVMAIVNDGAWTP